MVFPRLRKNSPLKKKVNATMNWCLFFAMGSPLGPHYCVFHANDRKHAEKIARLHYPVDYLYVVPWDARAQANVKVYGKKAIVMGQTMELVHARMDRVGG